MEINDFILKQPLERHQILTGINQTILENDKTITGEVSTMMSKEMIIYKSRGMMKYGLASGKHYMSLHVLPIYGSVSLHSKYKALLKRANFQKGCINFDTEDKMPLDIVKKLIEDCSSIDLLKIREDYLAAKKSNSKK